MRVFPIVCVLVAGVSLATAQPVEPPPPDPNAPGPSTPTTPSTPPTPPGTPSPTSPTTPVPTPVPPPADPPAPVPKTRDQAKLDRALAEAQCAARDPNCDWLATLGGLERASVLRAIKATGFQIEPSPWGKVVGKIHVHNEDVFAEDNWIQFLNFFHVTTKPHVIKHEVVIEPGEVWDQEKIEETARRIRDPLFSSVVVVIPVVSSEPGKVDVLVVTRDIWSLRLNTQYTFQQGKLTDLAMSLSENNFLGRRMVLAAAFTMDQGAIQTGPLFIDKNFLNEHLELRARINTILNRDDLISDGDFTSEGSSSTISLAKPLWKLASKWGGSASFTHRFAIDRRFRGTSLRPVWCPIGEECQTSFDRTLAPEDELLPWTYGLRRWNFGASAVRQMGTKVKQQFQIGYTVARTKARLLGDFPGTLEQREAFRNVALPRSELTSGPFVAYSLFTPKFKTRRNVQTYDLAEDLRLGPSLEASYGVGLRFLGSDSNFQRGGIGGSYTFAWGRDGSFRLGGSITTRLESGDLIDNNATISTRTVTPTFGYARIVSESSFATRWNDTSNTDLTIGSDNGLRGFAIDEFGGQRLFGTQVELRTIPTRIWVVRVGGVAFYDVGGAADTLSTLTLHHDVGAGIRFLFPQTSRELFRFDLAFPLDGAEAGSPKFSAGFQSEF